MGEGEGEGAAPPELGRGCWLFELSAWLDRDWDGDWVGDGLGVWEGELIGVREAYVHPKPLRQFPPRAHSQHVTEPTLSALMTPGSNC